MTRGRKPTPTHLKLVKGNPGRRPVNEAEAVVPLELPSVPHELCDDGKVEWGRVCEVLYNAGLLTKVDRAVLTAYCASWGQMIRARRAIAEMAANDPKTGGLLIKSPTNYPVQNPLVGIANKAAADCIRYAAELGMTPSARSRISAAPPADGENRDKGEAYFARR